MRVHAFFFFTVALILLLCSQGTAAHTLAYGLSATLVLFASVALHEWAHCAAVYRMGALPEQVVLWPLGGLVPPKSFHDPQSEVASAAAGPVANLLMAIVLLPIAASSVGWSHLLNPLQPPLYGEAITWRVVAVQAFWINWSLVWANLLPAPPTDMARIIRALAREAMGNRRALRLIVRTGRMVGIGLLIIAWLIYEPNTSAWFALALLGIFFFFSARDDAGRLSTHEHEEELFGYDFSQGYTSLERTFDQPPVRTRPVGRIRRWIQQRREARLRRQRQLEEEEDRRVDDILSRLRHTGMEGLTEEERALLERVSHRYRNRLGR